MVAQNHGRDQRATIHGNNAHVKLREITAIAASFFFINQLESVPGSIPIFLSVSWEHLARHRA